MVMRYYETKETVTLTLQPYKMSDLKITNVMCQITKLQANYHDYNARGPGSSCFKKYSTVFYNQKWPEISTVSLINEEIKPVSSSTFSIMKQLVNEELRPAHVNRQQSSSSVNKDFICLVEKVPGKTC